MLTKLAIITAGLLSSATPSLCRPSASPSTPDTPDEDLLNPRDGPHRLAKRSYTGMATYYETQTGNQGSCGTWLSDSAFTVAMSSGMMQDSYCGKQIWITYNGNTQYATVEDTCPGCVTSESLDFSPGLFQAFASEDVGTFSMTWDFVSDTTPTTSSTYQAPSSTSSTYVYVAPTTSSSKYVAPTTSSTWTPDTTTSYTPTSTYYPPTTSTSPTSTYVPPSSTYVAPSSSSSTSVQPTPSSQSSSTFTSPAYSSSSSFSSSYSSSYSAVANSTAISAVSRSVTAVLSTSIADAIISTATSSAAGASATGNSTTTDTTSASDPTDGVSGGNMDTLSQVIVNLGRFVVVNAAAS